MGYNPADHTEACHKLHAKYEAADAEYREKYPDHCTNCNGWGGWGSPGTWDSPPDFDTCDHCIGSGKCPRCGALTFTDDVEHKCSACGFDLDGLDCNGLPEPDYCPGFCKGDE